MRSAITTNKVLSTARWAGLALGIGLLAYWLSGGLLAKLELAASDVLFLIRGPLEEDSATVVVAIDDASFTQNELQWPWPRGYLAQIVDGVAAGNPRAIAIDVFFYEGSDPEEDHALAQAIGNAGNVVLTNDITTQTQGAVRLAQLNRPIPELDEAAAALGLANFPRDDDGVVRRLLAFQEHNDQLYFSWALQVARLALGEEDFTVVSPDEIRIGNRPLALRRQYLLVDYRGPAQSVPYYSAYQVADGIVDPKVFTDKIVLIGATSESLHDTYPTPFGSQPPTPGVEINAQAVDAILDGRFIQPLDSVAHLALAVLAAFIGIALVLRLRPITGLGAVIGVMLAYAALSAVMFIQSRVVLPITAPLLAVGLTYVAGTSVRLYEEQRARAQIRSLFDRYVSPAAIDQMLADPKGLALGGQRRELSILFSDIRGFTSLSEKLTPDEVVAILNEYLSVMTEIVFEHDGIVDKFEGDAILAVFNAPLLVDDHPSKAVRCGTEMIKRLTEMQAGWAAKGEHVLQIGIGINTGQAFVGNIGSARRTDYTVIGDVVNLASRLQDLTKEHGIPILFGEATRDKLSPDIETKFVATVQVKGRVQPVKLYTVEET